MNGKRARFVHVIAVGHHPHNRWQARPDGLYELAGSVHALDHHELRECASSAPAPVRCACFTRDDGTCGCGRCTGLNILKGA